MASKTIGVKEAYRLLVSRLQVRFLPMNISSFCDSEALSTFSQDENVEKVLSPFEKADLRGFSDIKSILLSS